MNAGSQPLLSTRDNLPSRFDDLLTLTAADELLSRRGLRTPFLRIAKDGRVLDTSRFTRSGGTGAEVADQIADDAVADLFLDGCTLVLQGLHRVWPPLIDFATRLAAELGHPVQVNAYITPPQSTGFSAHYDVHDVFVLQVAGEKRWVIHDPVHPAPLRNQPWTDHRRAVESAARDTPPRIDTVLRPGDALYLPRGYLHAAQALGDVSAHLTVGVPPLTRYTLVEALLALAADEPRLRGALPLGVDLADPGQVSPDLEATVEVLTDWLGKVDPARLTDQLRRRNWAATRPAPIAPLAHAAAWRGLADGGPLSGGPPDGGPRLALRGNLRHRLRRDGDRIVLDLPDRSITFPAVTEPALTALLGGSVLPATALPGLDAADSRVLARRLLREAVAVPVGE